MNKHDRILKMRVAHITRSCIDKIEKIIDEEEDDYVLTENSLSDLVDALDRLFSEFCHEKEII